MNTFTFGQFEVSGLPRRQAEALALAAMGKTAKESAQDAGTSPASVEQALQIAMLKLRARNKAHLVAMGFTAGMLRQAGSPGKDAA